MNCSKSFGIQNQCLINLIIFFCYSDCARDERYMSDLGLSITLICSGNGNYDSMQDENGMIFCVDRDGFAVSELIDPDVFNSDCSPFFYYT